MEHGIHVLSNKLCDLICDLAVPEQSNEFELMACGCRERRTGFVTSFLFPPSAACFLLLSDEASAGNGNGNGIGIGIGMGSGSKGVAGAER